MTISETLARLDHLEATLRGGLSDVIRVAGGDLAASIADRVINDGKGANNQPFSAYSTKPVPAFFYFGRSRSGSGEAKVRAASKKREAISYKTFREFNNLPTNFKNYSFTNSMWRGFGVKAVTVSANGYTLTIGGATTDAANKIDWNSQREGRSIIEPTRAEMALLKERIQNHLNTL